MSFKSDIAKKAAGASRFVLQKVLKRPGGFFPGDIALKINPDLLVELKDELDAGTVLVTGTNGKTSVTNLIADCMRYDGYEVAWNKTGANLSSGVVAAIMEFKPRRRKKKFGVFEVDELWVEKVLPQTKSKFLLLLNLFPDQVDRFGSIGNIQKSLINALNQSRETVLIYNCDDPNCQVVADECENNTIPFGVNEKISKTDDDVKTKCPICEFDLNYTLHQYAQLGNYRCAKCGFNRANPEVSTTNILLGNESLEFSVNGKRYVSQKAAEYACYNLTGFVATANALGCHNESIDKSIKYQQAKNGRMEFFELAGRQVMINLAKNPVGFNQNINYVMDRYDSDEKPAPTSVAFFVNAREGDGRNTN